MEETYTYNSDSSIPFHYSLSRKYRSMFICIVLLLLTTGLFISFIQVPVIVHARGMVRPEMEIIPIIAPLSGNISECRIKDGMHIKKNDTLIIFNLLWANTEKNILITRQKLIEKYIYDLKLLTNNKNNGFLSEKYESEFQAYFSVLKEKKNQKNLFKNEFKRSLSLYSDSLISQKEFEDIEQQYHASNDAINSYISAQLVKWTSDSDHYSNELLVLNERLNKLHELFSKSVIIAPVNGVIHEMKGLTENTYVYQHQHIGGISPDTSYFAEILINPSDIGWIYPGINGKILLDAYGSTYWEALPTECLFISDEFSIIKDQPFFIAKCSIDRHQPIMRNGRSEKIKKGMTLTVQFIITERTIIQLLTDKADTWLSIKNGIK